jgi:hypothetical protein
MRAEGKFPERLGAFDLTKLEDLALVLLLFRVKEHLELNYGAGAGARVLVDEGYKKNGVAICVPPLRAAGKRKNVSNNGGEPGSGLLEGLKSKVGSSVAGEAHYASQTATLSDRRIGSGESFIKNDLKARSGTPALKGAT